MLRDRIILEGLLSCIQDASAVSRVVKNQLATLKVSDQVVSDGLDAIENLVAQAEMMIGKLAVRVSDATDMIEHVEE